MTISNFSTHIASSFPSFFLFYYYFQFSKNEWIRLLIHPSTIYLFILHPIHSSTYPSIHPTINSFIYLSIHATMHPSIQQSIHPCIHSSMHPLIHQSIPSSIHAFTGIHHGGSFGYPEYNQVTSPSVFSGRKLYSENV